MNCASIYMRTAVLAPAAHPSCAILKVLTCTVRYSADKRHDISEAATSRRNKRAAELSTRVDQTSQSKNTFMCSTLKWISNKNPIRQVRHSTGVLHFELF